MIPHTNAYILDNTPAKDEIESWVNRQAAFCEPKSIHWVDGSQGEYDSLCNLLVKKGDRKSVV